MPTFPSPTTQTTVTANCQSYFYVYDGQMFVPLGSGSLYYHSIPITSATNWPTVSTTASWASSCNWAYWQAGVAARQAIPAPRPLRPALARPALLAGRRALRRSIEMFCRLRSDEEIRTFLSGEPLDVRGHRFDYRVQKRDDVLHHTMHPYGGHVPYRLSLHSKDGQMLASSGCIVIPNTPVIDQLLALILHVQDPEEEEVVLRRVPTGMWILHATFFPHADWRLRRVNGVSGVPS